MYVTLFSAFYKSSTHHYFHINQLLDSDQIISKKIKVVRLQRKESIRRLSRIAHSSNIAMLNSTCFHVFLQIYFFVLFSINISIINSKTFANNDKVFSFLFFSFLATYALFFSTQIISLVNVNLTL